MIRAGWQPVSFTHRVVYSEGLAKKPVVLVTAYRLGPELRDADNFWGM